MNQITKKIERQKRRLERRDAREARRLASIEAYRAEQQVKYEVRARKLAEANYAVTSKLLAWLHRTQLEQHKLVPKFWRKDDEPMTQVKGWIIKRYGFSDDAPGHRFLAITAEGRLVRAEYGGIWPVRASRYERAIAKFVAKHASKAPWQ